MIPFKNLNHGFSFIEMMVALTLLAIFGSSIFLVQTDIFSKIFKTHQVSNVNQDVLQELIQLKNKIQQNIIQKKEIDNLAIHETKQNPERKIDLVLQKIPESSLLYSTFSKNIRIVKSTITYVNNHSVTWYTFMYIPTIQKKEAKANQDEAKQPATPNPAAKTTATNPKGVA